MPHGERYDWHITYSDKQHSMPPISGYANFVAKLFFDCISPKDDIFSENKTDYYLNNALKQNHF
jgi:hypothetical protein